uniref:Serine/arginine repetitive matrix 3 n=1 Tax=Leptobrachium leishanense TaxID=445787 RepID=A0A8C5Q3C9_9ANUR
MSLCNNGARIPSPQETANGFPQAGASGTWHKPEEEAKTTEPNLVKKAHREILDHERKRRVELKCMELQEMMEEQGYSEEEIHQKVGTFRQMLMEKEGVLTREDEHGRHVIIENHYVVPGEECAAEYSMYGEGYTLQCNFHSDWYRDDSSHRSKTRPSSSISPPPKKRKKKKSSHKRSRCDSSSPVRKEKKKKSGKKHKRDRSRSLKNKRKDKNKDRKRSHSGSTARRLHTQSSCSSHSASPSSDYSTSKSPNRQSLKHRQDEHKPSSGRSSRSVSSSRTGHSRSATPHQNGHKSGTHNGHQNQGHGTLVEKHLDRFSSISPSPKTPAKVETSPSRHKGNNRHDVRSPRSLSSSKGGRCSSTEKRRHHSRSSSEKQRGRSSGRNKNKTHKESSVNSGSHTGYSSDSEGSVLLQGAGNEKNHCASTKKIKNRHHRGRQNSCSEASVKRSRQSTDRKKSPTRSAGNRDSSWSSSHSPSRSRSREKRSARSRSRSDSQKKSVNRDKDGEARTRHNEAEAARPRRRSRSYSPIRKRRRDSPSFMEPRRITSARKRPIPYYRPSPSSSSSLSSYSNSRSRSRSYDSYSSYSRSRTRSRSPSHSRSPSYRSSSDRSGF